MLKTHYANQITNKLAGKPVTVGGWIHDMKETGNLLFLILRDSTGFIQLTIKKDSSIYNQAKQLTLESVITAQGKVAEKQVAKIGGEVIPEKITILNIADKSLPVTLTKKAGVTKETQFKKRHIYIRHPNVVYIMQIKAEVLKQARNFLIDKGYTEIVTPIIVATATEGGSELFHLTYFEENAYLAQSSQLYKQATIAMHEKVFDIMPCFRAEKSRTTKHITEFWQIDIEEAFADDNDIMKVQEQLIQHIIKQVKKNNSEQLKALGRELKIPKLPLKRISYEEAIKMASKKGSKEKYGEDISLIGEMKLSKMFDDPFYIYSYPAKVRGIHYAADPEKPGFTKSFDMLLPEHGELSTGGLREHDYDNLIKRIKSKGIDPESQKWYLELFQYGMPPHAGTGIGVERLVRWLCGLEHVREAHIFPRTVDLLKP